MADIDELSLMLGNIQSDVQHIRANTEVTDRKLDSITESTIRQDASIKSAHKRIDVIVPHVEDYKTLKNKGVGVFSSIGLFFGVIGAFLGKIVTIFFG